MTFSWTGLSLEEIESSGKAIIIFGLGLLVVYLTLSAQYESFALPFIILLAVPTAILGALSLVALRGLTTMSTSRSGSSCSSAFRPRTRFSSSSLPSSSFPRANPSSMPPSPRRSYVCALS